MKARHVHTAGKSPCFLQTMPGIEYGFFFIQSAENIVSHTSPWIISSIIMRPLSVFCISYPKPTRIPLSRPNWSPGTSRTELTIHQQRTLSSLGSYIGRREALAGKRVPATSISKEPLLMYSAVTTSPLFSTGPTPIDAPSVWP